jgi:hypothetical protein
MEIAHPHIHDRWQYANVACRLATTGHVAFNVVSTIYLDDRKNPGSIPVVEVSACHSDQADAGLSP